MNTLAPPHPGSVGVARGRTPRHERRERLIPYLLLFPAVVFLLLVTLPPFFYGIGVSFLDMDLTMPDQGVTFVGLDNYRKVLQDPIFPKVFLNTVVYTGVSVVLSLVIGYALASLLHKSAKGKGLYQTLLLIPMVTTPLVIALGFRYMYDARYGVLAFLLSLIGVDDVSLLGTPSLALPAVIAVEVWEWTPFMALVLLAGMESLPRRPFEAAEVDGASRLQTFRLITLPMMRRVMMVAVLIRTMDAFKSFDIIYMMTRGGPGISTETMIMSAWREGFSFFRMGTGAALGMIMLYVILTTSWGFVRYVEQKGKRGG